MRRLIPAASAALALLAASSLAGPSIAGAAGPDGRLILAADSTQGTAPHTGTGLGNTQPPAEKMVPPAPPKPPSNLPGGDGVQGTAPHTGTGLGRDAPPPQTTQPPKTGPDGKMGGTSEDNAGSREKRMGEKPAP